MTTKGMGPDPSSWIMQRRESAGAPESQQHESKTPNRPQGETASPLGKFPAHDDQPQVNQPYQGRPDDFRVAAIRMRVVESAEVVGANNQANCQQYKSTHQQS